jgi:hypothetical protein
MYTTLNGRNRLLKKDQFSRLDRTKYNCIKLSLLHRIRNLSTYKTKLCMYIYFSSTPTYSLRCECVHKLNVVKWKGTDIMNISRLIFLLPITDTAQSEAVNILRVPVSNPTRSVHLCYLKVPASR